ncbi:MAG: hypothetical protein ABEK02_00835 [Haloquadratum sp.]
MNRVRSAILWGVVGVLAFLVLTQGYRLVAGGLGLSIFPTLGLAVLVGAVVTAVSFAVEDRLAAKGRT